MTRASSSKRHLFGLAPSGVCLAIDVTINAVVSYTAFSPLPIFRYGGSFLWHCPAGYPGWALPTTLLSGVRTFLGANKLVLKQRGDPDDSSVPQGYGDWLTLRNPSFSS